MCMPFLIFTPIIFRFYSLTSKFLMLSVSLQIFPCKMRKYFCIRHLPREGKFWEREREESLQRIHNTTLKAP